MKGFFCYIFVMISAKTFSVFLCFSVSCGFSMQLCLFLCVRGRGVSNLYLSLCDTCTSPSNQAAAVHQPLPSSLSQSDLALK